MNRRDASTPRQRLTADGTGGECWHIGEVKIHRIVEIEGPTNPRFILPDATSDALAPHAHWLRPHFLAEKEGLVLMSIQTFVVEHGGVRTLVDTCVGNDKERGQEFWHRLNTPFLEDLTQAGFPPESIDHVLCTHLHVDHVGWNTKLVGGRWAPTFGRARYLFGRREWEHWQQAEGGQGDHIADSVRPIVDAGLADLIETDHQLSDEVWLEPTPGHTPGHVSVRISSQGKEAVISGDVLHHPVQCSEPHWACSFDSDPELARKTRRAFLDRYADRPVLFIGSHFATPTAGRVVRNGSVWRFEV